MSTNFLQKAKFFDTINDLRQLPIDDNYEVAFVGRSNAGKSSAINTLTNQNKLAYTSKLPGRTQHINFFELGEQRFLVDLPGYGFARVSDKDKKHWQSLIAGYISIRHSLKGLVLMMDCRHPGLDLDLQLLDWFAPQNKPIHILLTKADKLNRQEQQQSLRKVQQEICTRYPYCTAQLFSSLKRTGVPEASQLITSWLNLF